MCWPSGELERALAGGAHRRELMAWFGESEYRRLAQLARAAAAAQRRLSGPARHRSGSILYLIPGLLGSQLGWPRGAAEPCDLLWLDATDIAQGRLMRLRWGGRGAPLRPLGGIAHLYLALQLRLAAAGYRVVLHDYDWREDIGVSAVHLARRLQEAPAGPLVLIGHSMGGLVARAALGACDTPTARRVARVIGLGTPHGGSIGAVQTLRATYPAVLRLAALDRLHSASELSGRVFHSFLSLYQMLPRLAEGPDLFDARCWPCSGLRPAARLLAAARGFAPSLPAADARFISIIGTSRRTATGLMRLRDQFRYEISDAGDGTVPARFATLPGARDYSLACEHSELPRSARVAAALIELIRENRTSLLRPGQHARRGQRVQVSDAMLRHALGAKLDWERLPAPERRRYLNGLNAPPPIYLANAS
jgi:pimeloyl-ACP methyl ester carboxylesterase